VGDCFRIVIAEAVHTCLSKEPAMLVVEWRAPGYGLRGDRPRLTVEPGSRAGP
jgi:hypothetical protein